MQMEFGWTDPEAVAQRMVHLALERGWVAMVVDDAQRRGMDHPVAVLVAEGCRTPASWAAYRAAVRRELRGMDPGLVPAFAAAGCPVFATVALPLSVASLGGRRHTATHDDVNAALRAGQYGVVCLAAPGVSWVGAVDVAEGAT